MIKDKNVFKFRICIAGHVVEIVSPGRIAYGFFRDFLTDADADFQINLEELNIDMPLNKSMNSDTGVVGWEGNVQVSELLRQLADNLIDYDVMLIHGAAISVNGEAYIFTAPSHTGKTTHILKWLQYCPETFVINGDKPFVKMDDSIDTPIVYSSPWSGKEELYTNAMVPLKSIIMIERADNNYIEQVSFAEAFLFLLQQIYSPKDEIKMRKTLKLMQGLKTKVSFWRFHCNNFKEDCFDVAYSALIGEKT